MARDPYLGPACIDDDPGACCLAGQMMSLIGACLPVSLLDCKAGGGQALPPPPL